MENPTEYNPSPSERAMLDAIRAEVMELIAQEQAVIKSIARVNKLLGPWEWDGQKFNKRN